MVTHNGRRLLVWALVVLVLLAVFSLYLQPDFLMTLGNQIWACSPPGFADLSIRYSSPLAGGNTSGLAKPDPRCSLDLRMPLQRACLVGTVDFHHKIATQSI